MSDPHPIEALAPAFAAGRYDVRVVEEGDLPDLLDVHADDAVTAYLPYASWHSLADARAWLARVRDFAATGRSRQFVVVERADGRVLGAVVVFALDVDARRAELGYVLGRRDWGRGVMRDVLPTVIERAFLDLDLRRIEAWIDPRNVASDRLLQRLGFVHEGTLRQRVVLKGVVVDSAVYGLLRDAWEAQQP